MDLDYHIQCLSTTLSQPWITRSEYSNIKSYVEKLVDAMYQYKSYLDKKNEEMKEVHKQSAIRVASDVLELCTIPAARLATIDKSYRCIANALRDKENYEAICLNELAPTDRYQRRHWLENIKLPFQTMRYRYPYGNHLGVVTYLWKVGDPVDETKASRLVSSLNTSHNLYASRETRKEFLDLYYSLTKVNKSVLRNIYKSLVGDCSAAAAVAESGIDERVAEALLWLDDPEFFYDLRKLNGNPGSSKFNAFWEELGLYIEELTPAVDDRRHSEIPHMPVAISLRHLLDIVRSRIEQKHPGDESKLQVPSLEWLRLQFWPRNPYSSSSLRHTGQLDLKFGVQVQQLRHDHVDSHYVSVVLRYLKEFCMQEREFATYLSIDDKAIIPIGEPGLPVSSGVRGHNQSIVLADGPSPSALDHDFHIHGIVPSVTFAVTIPESAQDSFYSGRTFVGLKDKVTQPSSPVRHATELSFLLKSPVFDNESVANKPILVIVSDGGPDHRISYVSVQLSMICLFQPLDLDMLVVSRTCPYQSWQNIAERVMSTLNLALMNIALARKEVPEEFERLLRNKNTLAEVREVVARHPGFSEALLDSLQQVLCTLSQRFSSMEVKGEPVKVTQACTGVDMKQFWEQIFEIQPSLSYEKINKKVLSEPVNEHIRQFMAAHCSTTKYLFQLKKCLNPDCLYCTNHPVRLPMQHFKLLSFVPLPLRSGEKYARFADMYGKAVDESDCPSTKPASRNEEVDKRRKAILVSSKVRCIMTCNECFKPRCVYSKSKLTKAEQVALKEVRESNLYLCGSSIFIPDSPYYDSVCVKESLNCGDPIELSYYSAALVRFPLVCYWCGMPEESLVRDAEYKELEKNFQIVHAICMLCKHDGKEPFTRHPLNAPKRKKIS